MGVRLSQLTSNVRDCAHTCCLWIFVGLWMTTSGLLQPSPVVSRCRCSKKAIAACQQTCAPVVLVCPASAWLTQACLFYCHPYMHAHVLLPIQSHVKQEMSNTHAVTHTHDRMGRMPGTCLPLPVPARHTAAMLGAATQHLGEPIQPKPSLLTQHPSWRTMSQNVSRQASDTISTMGQDTMPWCLTLQPVVKPIYQITLVTTNCNTQLPLQRLCCVRWRNCANHTLCTSSKQYPANTPLQNKS
jgi:hypothetical protein